MNERIKELMLTAFQEHYGDPITPGAREKAVELVSGVGEKFAELIVRESIVDFYRNYLDTTSYDDITEQVDRYVKQNFGVE